MINFQNNELAEFTFVTRYAKYLKHKKRRETWIECVDRMEDMHLTKFAHIPEILPYIKEAMQGVREKRVLGSQRALQFGGEAILKRNPRIFNCTGSYCDRLRVFQEALALLLYGCGVGLSIQFHHVNKLPTFSNPSVDDLKKEKIVYTIPDTIEGWADALGVLLSSYFENPIFPEFYNREVVFDYSLIRPKGSEFSHGIGTAPGPDGLRNALDKIRHLIHTAILNGQDRLKPIDCCDIYCHLSDAVLSGGVRRSAGILFFSIDDEEMMMSKTGNWLSKNPQRARVNISFVGVRNKLTWDRFRTILQSTKQYGEPGVHLTDDPEHIGNPCEEIGFYCYDANGNSGWQACNLSTINGGLIQTVEDFYAAARLAAIIGTMQADYTDFAYIGKVSENIIKQEALIGVSITGIMTNPKILCNPEYQRCAAEIVKQTNREIAKLIGINPAARTTCIKPEGTSTTILGLGSFSGHSPGKGKKFIRNVQSNKTEPPVVFFRQINPTAVENSVWSATDTDNVLSFICSSPDNAIMEDDLTAINYLKMIQSTQINWVRAGTNQDLCVSPGLEHNVSNTIRVRECEWEEVFKYLFDNKFDFKAVSFIGDAGDRDYEQAPFVRFFNEYELAGMYGPAACFASGLIDKALHRWNNRLWMACIDFLNKHDDLSQLLNEEQLDWIDSASRFTLKYLNGDRKKFTYLLKDVYNYNRVINLSQKFKSPDFTECIEEKNNTVGTHEIACAGGACLI